MGELDQFLTQPEATQAMYDAATAAIGREGPWRAVWSAMMEASDIPARVSKAADTIEALQSRIAALEALPIGPLIEALEEWRRIHLLLKNGESVGGLTIEDALEATDAALSRAAPENTSE